MAVEIEKLILIVEDIAKGNYSNDIFDLINEDTPEYINRLVEAIGMMMVKIEAREMKLESLIEELKILNDKIRKNSINAVTSISKALGARDKYTEGHVERVAGYAERLAKKIGLDEKSVETIKTAGLLHDIGKINFSDKIFSNVDINLSKDMSDEIQRHPSIGYKILKDLDFLGNAIDYVHYHHERLDGKGYPNGLSAEQIPIGARIISICDCFDAITFDRSYQKGKPMEEAFAILRKISNSQIDGHLTEEFIEEIMQNGMIKQ